MIEVKNRIMRILWFFVLVGALLVGGGLIVGLCSSLEVKIVLLTGLGIGLLSLILILFIEFISRGKIHY